MARTISTFGINENQEEMWPPASCFDRFSSQGYPMKRKVADVRGRLGSLYDSATDQLIELRSLRPSKTKSSAKSSICEIFQGEDFTQPLDYLALFGFNTDLQRSIRQQTVPISAVARFIQYNQPITQYTRFFYYSFTSRREKLDQIACPQAGPTDADYMITKIDWGFEVLCVLQIPPRLSVAAADQLLLHLRSHLKHNNVPVRLDDNDRRIINQLNNGITVFGTDTCVDDPYKSLFTILQRIPDWQNNLRLHQPLFYTMQPLGWLCSRQVHPSPLMRPGENVAEIEHTHQVLHDIDRQMKEVDRMLSSFPRRFTSEILHRRLGDHQRHYQLLLATQINLEQTVERTIADIHRQRLRPAVLNDILNNLRYQCLQEGELDEFRTEVERLLNKSILIGELYRDGFEYVNAFDIGSIRGGSMTNEAIDARLRSDFSGGMGVVVLWYTSDRLRREQVNKWQQMRDHLLAEQQRAAERVRLIYVDFTQCPQRLENHIVTRFL